MTDLPAPLTPADCDLRDFAFMPLEVARLRRSKAWLAAKRNPALAFYMVNLWSAAWHDLPAASLEDDDDVLADLAMCEPRQWPKVREAVLRGWVKCSDGRLYHPVVAEKAAKSWEAKQAQRARTRAARQAKKAKRTETATGVAAENVTDTMTATATTSVTGSKGEGEGEGELSVAKATGGRSPAAPPMDPRDALWTEGLARLRRITGKSDGAARSLLGKLVKQLHDDCPAVTRILVEAEDCRPGDPVAWLEAAIAKRLGRTPGKPGKPADGLPEWYAEPGGTPQEPEGLFGAYVESTAEEVR